MTDFGERLRQSREARGISLRQISANTKISLAALEALERNDVSKLPGGIFSRSFVRSYAAEVGLDPDTTVSEFVDRFKVDAPPDPELHLAREEDDEEETRHRAAGFVARALLGLMVLAAVFAFFMRRGDDRAASAATPPPAPRAEVATTAPPSTSQPAVPAVDDVLRATGPMRLEIHPTRACWVKLSVDGDDAFAKLMQAGQKEAVTVKELAVISIGDAGAFAYTIDGHPGKPLGASGEVKTVRISRATLAEYLR